MHRGLPHLIALLLGIAVALLAGCGQGTKAGVPAADAGDLKREITDVREAVDDARCSDVPGQLRQVDEGVDALPQSTDERLRQALSDGVAQLRSVAQDECNANADERRSETTTTQTETTPAETTPAETTPAETTPAETTPAETTPAETTPAETTPVQPPPAQPPPPPATPGGGTPPGDG